jgi:uncharacterized protein YodC (DUF2158 family)
MSLQCCPAPRTITVFLLALLALGATGAVAAAPRTAAARPPAAATHPQPAPVNPQPAPVNPQPAPVNPQPAPVNPQPAPVNPQPAPANPPEAITPNVNVGGALSYFTVTPCRVFDSRLPANAPALQTGVARLVQITGNCGIPADAKVAAVNLTVTQPTAAGTVELYRGDGTAAGVADLDFASGQTRANNAVVALAFDGSGTLNALLTTATTGQTSHLILDLNGYFKDATPVAQDDSYNTTLNTPLNQAAPGVLANDTLNGAAIFSYGATTGAEQTTIGAATPTSAAGSVTLNADGSFNYTPATGFKGNDTFKYVIKNAAGSSTATVTISVGKGNQTITFTSTAPAAAKVGGPTYNVTATASSGLTVAFTIDASAASVCSISGSTVSFIGVGTCVIDANQAGDANYNPAPQVQQSFAVAKGDQTINFTSTAPAAAKVGGPTYNVTATATSGLTVAFTIDASAASVCSISGSTVSFIGVGTCVIDANQAGDANYNAAPQAQQSFAVGKGDQTITFTSTAPASAKVGGPTYTVTATASSGLTVTFTIDASATSVCSISGSTVSFTAAGTCVIDANQAGNATYNAAPQAQQSFAVGKSDQTINFTSTAPAGAKVAGPTYTVTATATSGLTVAFTIDAAAASVCSISGSTVSFIGVGTCVIDANQAGDSNYNAAPQVQQSFAVAKGDQTINFTSTAPAGAKVAGPTYNVTATASSGLAVTLTIDAAAASVCSISGSTVSFIGVGTCVIDANQAGNANYNAAPQAQQSFAVAKGDQTINFTSTAPAGAKVAGPTYNVTATASSGLAVTFTIDASASSVCSISGSTVSFIGAGTCVIDANQGGNANYNAAPQAQQSFAVAKGDQTITFTSTAPAKVKPGGPTYTVTATASSGLTVAFTIDAAATSFCSISGSTVSFTADGTCVIDANQAGSANYNAAPQVQQSILVDAPPTVTSTSPANNAINVPLASTISITFSKPANVTGSAFTLACSPGAAPAFTVTPASPATTFVLHPSANLPFDSSCTVTVVANQVTSNANTQMDTNYVFSFATPPIANADNRYSTTETLIGNVSIDSSKVPYSVLTNDQFNSPVTITAYDAISANGGTVTMNTSNGQFTYNPKAGYKGADSFTYTIGNAHGSSTATVSLTLSGIIWFIDGSAGAGDGRLSSPFNSLAAFQAVNDGVGLHPADNANVFLYDNASAYTGPVVLRNGQKLIGQDATSSLSTISGLIPGTSSATLPSTGGGSPNKVSITATGNDVTLGSGNTVWGLTLGNATSGIALSGSSVGSLKLRDMTINTTGGAVSLANGALDAILKSVSSGGGTHGISLTTTTGSFDVEGDGASDPANTTRGRTTAKNGGGTLTLGSGGTIQSATSAGVLLSTATNVTLRNMTIQNNGSGINTGGDGITWSSSSGLTLDNVLITGHAGNHGLHGTTVSGLTLVHTEISANATAAGTESATVGPAGTALGVWNVRFDSLSGTCSATASLFFNSRENIFGIEETGTTTLTSFTISNSEFRDTATSAPGNDGLLVEAYNTSNVSFSVSNSTFLRSFGSGVQYNGNDSSGGGTLTIGSSTFDQNGHDVNLTHQGLSKTVTFNIHDNSMRQTVGGKNTSISATLGGVSNASTLFRGHVTSNIVGNQGVTDSGSALGQGITLTASGAGTLTATVDSNKVRQIHQDDALFVIANGTSSTLNATITNNDLSVSTTSGSGLFGIDLSAAGPGGSDTPSICAHLFSNVAAIGDPTLWGIQAQTVSGNPTIQLEGYGGAANNTSQINSFLNTTATTVSPPAQSFVFAGTIKAASAACPTPP